MVVAVAPEPEASAEERVAAVLESVRAGVRQRVSELTTVSVAAEEGRRRLVELRGSEYVREPAPVSPRPLLGRAVVWMRKAFFHLFLKWFERPVWEQQNRYNQAATELLQDLVERQERAERELAELRAELGRQRRL
jgi:hypothetical protein